MQYYHINLYEYGIVCFSEYNGQEWFVLGAEDFKLVFIFQIRFICNQDECLSRNSICIQFADNYTTGQSNALLKSMLRQATYLQKRVSVHLGLHTIVG